MTSRPTDTVAFVAGAACGQGDIPGTWGTVAAATVSQVPGQHAVLNSGWRNK